MLDTNQDGMVNAAELKRMMEMLGINVSDAQVQDLIQQASRSGILQNTWHCSGAVVSNESHSLRHFSGGFRRWSH